MIMKNLVVFFSVAIFLLNMSACSSYYYSTLSSTDFVGDKNEYGDFVQENDTVQITYSFYGEDAPVRISILNKLNEPLFVDWMRSAIIIDETATSYYQETASIKGDTRSSSSGDVYRWNRNYSSTYEYSRGTFSGEVTLPKGLSFIPPKARIENTPLALANFPFDKIPKDAYEKAKIARTNGDVVSVRIKKFTEEDSPVYFKSYLTLYTGDREQQKSKEMFFERSFYVSRLIKTGNVKPNSFEQGKQKSGDFFYVHNVKGKNAGIITGVIAIGAAAVVVDAAIGPAHY